MMMSNADLTNSYALYKSGFNFMHMISNFKRINTLYFFCISKYFKDML